MYGYCTVCDSFHTDNKVGCLGKPSRRDILKTLIEVDSSSSFIGPGTKPVDEW